MEQDMENATSKPSRTGTKPFPGGIFWIVDILLVLLVTALIFLNPIEFMSLNYLYHLGQQKKWEEAYRKLPTVRESYQSNPRYSLIKLETLLHLAKNSEALELIRSKRDLMDKKGGDAVKFQQLAGFGFILLGKDEEASEVFRSHSGNALSKQFAMLIDGVVQNRGVDIRKMPVILDLAEASSTYPDLPFAVVKYLFSRAYLQKDELPEAIELLEEIIEQWPYEYVFQRTLGVAYLDSGRFDLANIHLRIARQQLHDRDLYPYSPEEEKIFEQAVLRHAFKYSESRLNSEFWRLLRAVSAIFHGSQNLNIYAANLHPYTPTELWEWAQFKETSDPAQWEGISSETLSLKEKRIHAAVEGIIKSSIKTPIPTQTILSDRDSSITLLHAQWISNQETGLVNTGQSITYHVPPAKGYIESGMILCLIRGSLREGIPGGCEIRLGQDKYYVPLQEKPQWHAFPLPVLATQLISMTFRFNSDSIPGYTEKENSGDRNLYIMRVLACYMERK